MQLILLIYLLHALKIKIQPCICLAGGVYGGVEIMFFYSYLYMTSLMLVLLLL